MNSANTFIIFSKKSYQSVKKMYSIQALKNGYRTITKTFMREY